MQHGNTATRAERDYRGVQEAGSIDVHGSVIEKQATRRLWRDSNRPVSRPVASNFEPNRIQFVRGISEKRVVVFSRGKFPRGRAAASLRPIDRRVLR